MDVFCQMCGVSRGRHCPYGWGSRKQVLGHGGELESVVETMMETGQKNAATLSGTPAHRLKH